MYIFDILFYIFSPEGEPARKVLTTTSLQEVNHINRSVENLTFIQVRMVHDGKLRYNLRLPSQIDIILEIMQQWKTPML